MSVSAVEEGAVVDCAVVVVVVGVGDLVRGVWPCGGGEVGRESPGGGRAGVLLLLMNWENVQSGSVCVCVCVCERERDL